MAEEEPKKKINFKKIALFGLGPVVLIGIGLGVGAFLFMPTQTPVEQVEELIEKKLQQAGQLPCHRLLVIHPSMHAQKPVTTTTTAASPILEEVLFVLGGFVHLLSGDAM